MKRNILIIIIVFIILTCIISLVLFTLKKNRDEIIVDNSNPIPTVSEVALNTKQYINQLEKVKIEGTDDTIIITEKVKWDIADPEEGTTISFSIAIPYTITVDGIDYTGIYQLSDYSWDTQDTNPKYKFEVTNLTKNGDIEILITNKNSNEHIKLVEIDSENWGEESITSDYFVGTHYEVYRDGSIYTYDSYNINGKKNEKEFKVPIENIIKIEELLKSNINNPSDNSGTDGTGWTFKYFDDEGNKIGEYTGYIYMYNEFEEILQLLKI